METGYLKIGYKNEYKSLLVTSISTRSEVFIGRKVFLMTFESNQMNYTASICYYINATVKKFSKRSYKIFPRKKQGLIHTKRISNSILKKLFFSSKSLCYCDYSINTKVIFSLNSTVNIWKMLKHNFL